MTMAAMLDRFVLETEAMSAPALHAIAQFEGRFGYNTHTRGFFEALAASRPVAASPLVGLKGPWAEDQRFVTNVFGSRAISIAC